MGLIDDAEQDAVVVGSARIALPVLTVADCRAWMEYMRGLGESSEADVVGGAVLEHLTLSELYYLLPDLADDELEPLTLAELAGLEAAFIARNEGFIAMRRRIVRAGEQYLRAAAIGGGAPAGVREAQPSAGPGSAVPPVAE